MFRCSDTYFTHFINILTIIIQYPLVYTKFILSILLNNNIRSYALNLYKISKH